MASASTPPIYEALEHSFGFSSFRPHQEEIVAAILAGRDVFAALPTGGGKSLCYQLPALLLPGLTVVVSPLIALMHDQVAGARGNGVPAAFLNSSLTQEEARQVYADVRSGSVRLLYVSPERMALEGFRAQLRELGVVLFAIDEAHCISEWGHEFRPDYRALSVLRGEFPDAVIAAFTATATEEVQADVIRLLELRSPLVVRGDFDRREIFYRVERKQKLSGQILSFVRSHGLEPGIIYRATRKSVEETAALLVKHGTSAVPYHAGLPDAERASNQERFVRDEVQVVVATIAFGMGIDKPNVRWVLHADLPRSLEAYYQESGRAGRDGEPAEACLIYGPQDLATIRYHIDRMEVPEEQERARERLREMLRYVSSGVCRRVQLLAHFNQEPSAPAPASPEPAGRTSGPRHATAPAGAPASSAASDAGSSPGDAAGGCANCDVCTSDTRLVDRSVDAQKAMSAMVRTGERFGAHHIADIVAGNETDRILRFRHDRLPTFGVGADRPREWWLGLIGDLEAAGLVRRRDGAASGLVLAGQGRRVLLGKETFLAAEHEEYLPRGARTTGDSTAGAGPAAGAAPSGRADARQVAAPVARDAQAAWGVTSGDEESLFQCLRALRRRLAREQSVPPYVIFSDKSLKAMAGLRPANRAALLQVHGVGDRKADLYGELFLSRIREFEASGECPEA